MHGPSPPSQDPSQATTFFLRAESGVKSSDIHGLKFQLEHIPTDCHRVNFTEDNSTAADNGTAANGTAVAENMGEASNRTSSEGAGLDTGAVQCSPLRVKARMSALDKCLFELFAIGQMQRSDEYVVTATVIPPHCPQELDLSQYLS